MLTTAEEMKKVGRFIKTNRIAKNLSQEEVAKAIGVARNTIASWERGEKEPGVLKFLAVVKVLEADIREFIDDDGKDIKTRLECLEKEFKILKSSLPQLTASK